MEEVVVDETKVVQVLLLVVKKVALEVIDLRTRKTASRIIFTTSLPKKIL